MAVQIQALNPSHDCRNFDCGTPALNLWLADMASQQQKKNIARTFVLVDLAEPANILGFYTLAVSEISREALPNANKFPRRVPVVRLGRFAVQSSAQQRGFGSLLLLNALERVAEISLNAGIAAIVVDAKDTQAADYYQRHDFVPSPENPLQLFLPTRTLQAAFQKTGLK